MQFNVIEVTVLILASIILGLMISLHLTVLTRRKITPADKRKSKEIISMQWKQWLQDTSAIYNYYCAVLGTYDSFALKLSENNKPIGWIQKGDVRVDLDSDLLRINHEMALNKACMELNEKINPWNDLDNWA